MTTLLGSEPGEASEPSDPALEAPTAPPGRWRTAWRRELTGALEILALTSFVVARPVFGSFGRSPETFVARGSDWNDVILFALVVLLLPPALLVAVELAVGIVAPFLWRWVHALIVGIVGTGAAWQLIGTVVEGDAPARLVGSIVLGALLAVAAARVVTVRTFLRYAAIGAPVFLLQFLLLAPVSAIVLGERHGGVSADTAAAVSQAIGPDAPPVVLVVFDGLPTEALLDGTGHIDAKLYPNIAKLAGDGTWYRNNTTVAQYTLAAVPAILSGQRPDYGDTPPVVGNYKHNLFTLLGDAYQVHGGEQITGICPVEMCPEEPGNPLNELLHDADDVWHAQMKDVKLDPELVPQAFDDRYGKMHRWIEQQDFSPAEKPGLFVYHLLLPHPGWDYLPDGSGYATTGGNPPRGMYYDTWGDWGAAVGRQRHVLQAQAADHLLGELLDKLEASGAYDRSVIAMTADHGYAFAKDAPWRALAKRNVDEILWTPLIVKGAGQHDGTIDDRNTNTTDVVPTIAREVGIRRLPWKTAGQDVGRDRARRPGDKWVVDWRYARLRPSGGGHIVHVDGDRYFPKVLDADWVEGTGPLAVWRTTEYGQLVNTRVADHTVRRLAGTQVTVKVEGPERWQAVDPARPPIELVGFAPLPGEGRVAVAVNGRIAAVTATKPGGYGVSLVQALLWPGALRAGANDVKLYLVDGPVAAPVLHPVGMAAQG